jgi:hypothetical protein
VRVAGAAVITLARGSFGCGFLREAAFLGHLRPNVYVGTSSSNSWLTCIRRLTQIKNGEKNNLC